MSSSMPPKQFAGCTAKRQGSLNGHRLNVRPAANAVGSENLIARSVSLHCVGLITVLEGCGSIQALDIMAVGRRIDDGGEWPKAGSKRLTDLSRPWQIREIMRGQSQNLNSDQR
jgi:hypothetical protein